MSFTGFPPTGLALLARLPSLDPTGFAVERPGWDELLDQARHFVTDLGAALARRISPDLVADPRVNGSIAPINRDLRFDPHGPRYKDHLLFRWWEGTPKKTSPTLYVRLDPTRIGFASGIVFTSTDRWRAAAASADRLHQVLADIRHTVPDFDIAGADLKRVPAPFPPDHPGADLLRHKTMFQLRWAEPLPNEVTTPRLVDHAASRLVHLAALHRWLREEVA
jgi:uncharacterized protein (DUF2461 family)